ncbi:UNVERIFIED_CONTAM: DNA polymerase III epsilon subunit family exonuclease [Acetivibrio alkalicellulosi]
MKIVFLVIMLLLGFGCLLNSNIKGFMFFGIISVILFVSIKQNKKYNYYPTNIKGINNYKQLYHVKKMPVEFIIIDLETTGISKINDRIIEIGIVKYKDGNIIESYNELINPEIPIPLEATRVNNITNGMVKNKKKIHEVIEHIFNMINGQIVVGYNVNFDLGFLDVAFGRSNLIIDNIKFIDVLQIVKETINPNEISNKKLVTVKNYFGIKRDSHRALDDCLTTADVFKNCIKILEERDLKIKREQEKRISDFNKEESLFIEKLKEYLNTLELNEHLTFNVLSNKTINFCIDEKQLGRVKLRGRNFKMQVLDKDNVLWLDIDDVNEAINNLKHWGKYAKYLIAGEHKL